MSDEATFGQSPSDTTSRPVIRLSKNTKGYLDHQAPAALGSGLPFISNPTTPAHLTIKTPPISRPLSPSGGSTASHTPSATRSGGSLSVAETLQVANKANSEAVRALILQAFVPHIAVTTSADTEDLVREKGFSQGLWQLLRPFGDQVQGKVVIRDSIGASRVCEDFAVRFIKLGEGLVQPLNDANERNLFMQNAGSTSMQTNIDSSLRTESEIQSTECVVEQHLNYAEERSTIGALESLTTNDVLPLTTEETSPFFMLYLRKLLSGMSIVPSETFSHPTACIIAISSRSSNPIEELRRLYDESTRGDKRFPRYVNGEYLRYYVLIHDEERDDIGKSMSLFEQMKRHFGLHCHLLRLRSSRCVPSDDDSIVLPLSKWMSTTEELVEMKLREEQEDLDATPPCIFDSDATAISTFIREMVTQSVVPSMERCVATWNDQVASRRRGISGRFMSLSKKFTVFGNGKTSPSSGSSPSGSNSNYDSSQGVYLPETPEAIMRKLADYAFMLRDWKLAQSVYDLVKSDFYNDKAWKYHAAANEMGVLATLLASHAIGSKVRAETVDQMLETASYSYLTRCSSPYGALRCLILGMELLRMRGGSGADDAARWGTKILESNIVGPIGDALVKERIAGCYSMRKASVSKFGIIRARKSYLWNILAAESWVALGKCVQARQRLALARASYKVPLAPDGVSKFALIDECVVSLERELHKAYLFNIGGARDDGNDDASLQMDEESEAFDIGHRQSLVGAAIPTVESLETAPLHTT